ncbi:MAG: YfiR family protein [Nitrospirales bacterium]
MISVTALSPLSQAEGPSDDQIKATYLYHFTKFVEWPTSSFTLENSPLQLCVMEPDTFGPFLETTLKGKSSGTHSLIIKRHPSTKEIRQCHMLFLSKQQASLWSTLRASLAHTTVLTVGEHGDFLKEGGMIQFYRDGQKIRFAINPQTIKQTQLRVSAKLWRLAKIVNP